MAFVCFVGLDAGVVSVAVRIFDRYANLFGIDSRKDTRFIKTHYPSPFFVKSATIEEIFSLSLE